VNQRAPEPYAKAWEVKENQDNGERTETTGSFRPFSPVALSSSHPAVELPRTVILGIPLHTVSLEDAILAIMERLDAAHPSHVCFVNAHCANLAYRDPEYLRVLQTAALSFPDGVGLRLAGRLLGRPILHNVNGTDLFPLLCAAFEESNAGVFLFGGLPGVPEAVREWLSCHYPRARVCGWRHGYFSSEEEPLIVRQIADSGARLVLVALGAPLQDLWISRHLPALGVKVAMGVGGLFDFYSGRLPRAPLWLRNHGGEWAYRLHQEPLRLWKRYMIGNPFFLARVLRERFYGLGQNFDAQRWSANIIRKTFLP
jgi:N-acetylglucosaminyldiphosphoundecaprenol N-acetyl-beta-D-mannosaminyltransferase